MVKFQRANAGWERVQKEVFLIFSGSGKGGLVKGVEVIHSTLSAEYSVSLVALRYGVGQKNFLGANVVDFAALSWFGKYRFLNNISDDSIIFSFGFFSDLFCWIFLGDRKNVIPFLRSNLKNNYKLDSGLVLGALKFWVHRFIIWRLPRVLCLFKDLQFINHPGFQVIRNFIDEESLNKGVGCGVEGRKPDQASIRLLYVGTLSLRKDIGSLIYAMSTLESEGVIIELTLIGDGPEMDNLRVLVAKTLKVSRVVFCGYLENPFSVIERPDYYISCSKSEGVSRSAMEALFLGIPVIAKGVDGFPELISVTENGYLFASTAELCSLLIAIWRGELPKPSRSCLLPNEYRKKKVSVQLTKFIEGV